MRLRLVALLAGLGALATCGSVAALVLPLPAGAEPPAHPSPAALGLLQNAVRATMTRAWSGTQHVVTMTAGTPQVSEAEVRHVPGRGSWVDARSGQAVVAADVFDGSLLSVLAGTYDLQVTGTARCDGRLARVVEARRTDGSGVAGRFWLDTASGLVLRRDVLAADGSLLRSSEILGLRVGPALPMTTVADAGGAATELRPGGERLGDAALTTLAGQGWVVPRALPGGLVLFDARLHDDDVLQLSYSDGLSTLSLFGQRGELPRTTSGIVRTIGGGRVREWPGEPERVVWSEHGRTWTLVSDAPQDVVDATVGVLPHGTSRASDGFGPRVWRGMARVGAWLNPFD